MISEDIVQSYIQKISLIKQGQFDDYMSHTRDVFDSRLMTYTSKNQQWLFGAVIGEIGANTFDHNFSFRTDVPKGVYCDFDSGDAFCKVDGSGYEFGKASFIHDGCFCILSCKGE